MYEKIYEVVKEATNKGKAVTIHCGAGDGRSGTALASLKLRELLEIDIINSFLLGQTRENTLTTVSTPMNNEVPCSYAVKNAVEQTRNQRGELDGENGKHSVETANDIATLMQYEAYLRNKLTLKLIYDEKKLATYIEKAIEEEKTRLGSSVRKENCARERLEFLEHVLKSDFKDKSNIYAKLKTYNSLVSINESLEDLKHFVLNQENCSDEVKHEKIKRIDEFISMLENKQVSVSLRFRAVKMEVLSPEFKDLFMKDSDYVLIRWFKLCIQSLFDIYNPSLSKYSMFSHKIGDLESSFENQYEQKNVRS